MTNAAITLHQVEVLMTAHDALLRHGEFETCADPRGYIRAANRLFDACLDCGMPQDEPNHEWWAAEFHARQLCSAEELA
jgi:hypothetical protein